MKYVNNASLKDSSNNNNLFNVIHEQNIKNERKGQLMYLIN